MKIGSLQSKLSASEGEDAALREKNMCLRTLVVRFRSDVQMAIKEIQNPKGLTASIKELFAKYCSDDAAESTLLLDEELQQEHNRQREFLERSIASLRHKVANVLWS
jgi:hypothetical protein